MPIVHTHYLIALLIFLICIAAFFSAAEIGVMSLNRYRLRHLVRKKNRGAKRVSQLLERPDRLLGVILIGNNFATILSSAIATIITVHFFGDAAVAVATLILTLVIIIFAEIMPKTLAALHPERVAFPSSWVLKILLKVLYPLIFLINGISNGFLRLFGVQLKRGGLDTLSHEELRTIVREATGKTLGTYQEMLVSILDLGQATVEDIMIPRNEIAGIDLDQNWEIILKQLMRSEHTRLPIYTESIDNVKGILHVRKVLNLMARGELDKESLVKIADEAYFVPEGTALNLQLVNFRKKKSRSAFVVDEYGDILGLITLEDILEEIIGEFTTKLTPTSKDVFPQKDGSYLVNGSASVRDLNRMMQWQLPIEGPKTLSGLIVEYLEALPTIGVGLRLAGYPIEVIEVSENTVKIARIWPKLRSVSEQSEV